MPQIVEIEKLGAFAVPNGATLPLGTILPIPETVRYILSPTRIARTMIMRKHKVEVITACLVGTLLVILTTLRVADVLGDTLFTGLTGLVVAIGAMIVAYFSRQ